jgi:uncharacterized protein YheU (UPF0270 family)
MTPHTHWNADTTNNLMENLIQRNSLKGEILKAMVTVAVVPRHRPKYS